MTQFADLWVRRGDHRIFVRKQDGAGPTIVLMHGYPDNHHLYDLLVPHLEARHVVTFDFLGWGESDKPENHDYTYANQREDLDAVIAALDLDRVVLVPHDTSGPAAFNWALDHPDRVATIVALNTFYSLLPERSPEPARGHPLVLGPGVRPPHRALRRLAARVRWLYEFQVGGFIRNDSVRARFVPLLFRQFEDKPSTVVHSWN